MEKIEKKQDNRDDAFEMTSSEIDAPEAEQEPNDEDHSPEMTFEPMSDAVYFDFSAFIQAELGIKMPETNRPILQSHLQERLQELELKTFDEYHDYVFSSDGLDNELDHLIDAAITCETAFFREPHHFEYLYQEVFPRLIKRKGVRTPFRIWSAGCSTGEEPYSLAMILSELREKFPGFHFSLLATDISEKALEHAKLGIYSYEKIDQVPQSLKEKYFLKSKEKDFERVRIVPELRSLVTFRRLNLLDQDFGIRKALDIIFCRNVLIYFDSEPHETVLSWLCRYLKPGGYMFTGQSEVLNWIDIPLSQVADTVYRKIVVSYSDVELPMIFLKPGEMVVSETPVIVETVLGSCIAVTMFSHRLRIAAICHAILPQYRERKECEENDSEKFKYVDTVIPEMLQKLRNFGIESREIEVKLFGGAEGLGLSVRENINLSVGRSNVEMAMQMINTEHLRLTTSDTGGRRGRKIFFHTYTGEVKTKRLRESTQRL